MGFPRGQSRVPGRLVTCLVWLGMVLVTFVAFEPTLRNGFVGFDDSKYVTENVWVKSGVNLKSISWSLTTTHFNWHPLTWLSHMLDVDLYGLSPQGHHLTSVLLHILNTLLLFALLHRMTGDCWPSVFGAALFALHPLRVEVVAWVAERKELLSTLFGLLSTWAYVEYARRGGFDRYTHPCVYS